MDNRKHIKLAILGSYTLNNILPSLAQQLSIAGFTPDIRLGAYNQFIQELMDKNSWVYEFKPDVLMVALSFRTYFENLEFEVGHDNKEDIASKVRQKFDFLRSSIESCDLPCKFIITNIDVPVHSPHGLRDLTHPNSLLLAINEFNNSLYGFARENGKVHILDFDTFCSKIGKLSITDEKMFYLGKILLAKKPAEKFSGEIVSTINALYGRSKKCLITDLDNTLWGGVVGEEGASGIVIGDTSIGKIYEDVQKALLTLKKNGVLLCIASKNNEEDALEAFRTNEKMVLREQDFIIKKINWKSKTENITEIAQELNIGLDSIVFLDDSPSERLEVKTRLPMVEVIDFPIDVASLPMVLKELKHFVTLSLTEEDLKRHQMYEEERKRSSIKESGTAEEFLRKLGTRITVRKNHLPSLERVTQLINKTNQFNLRTQRYTPEEIRVLMESKEHLVYSLYVEDNFGDLGLTGAAILLHQGDHYFIDTFLLSCRILSRKIEHQFFHEIINSLKGKTERITAEYIPSAKNEPARGFFESLGMRPSTHKSSSTFYDTFIKEIPAKNIDTIEVITDGN